MNPATIAVGDRIRFNRPDGKVCDDVVRELFTQSVCLMPMAPNQQRPAAVLTEHSWCFLDDIVEVLPVVWEQFTKRTEDPKLAWIEAQLDDLGIKHRRNGESWHAPILEVQDTRIDDAWKILARKVNKYTIDDIRDDAPMFRSYDHRYSYL